MITGIADQVAPSTGTEPPPQHLDSPSAAITTTSIHPSGAVAQDAKFSTPTWRTGASGCGSQNLPPVTDAGTSTPALASVGTTLSDLSPTNASNASIVSRPVSPSFPSDTTLVPKILALLPSHPTLGTVPTVASSVFSGSYNNFSSSMVPPVVAVGTVQDQVPSQNHTILSVFPIQSPALQTGSQTLNSTSSLPRQVYRVGGDQTQLYWKG